MEQTLSVSVLPEEHAGKKAVNRLIVGLKALMAVSATNVSVALLPDPSFVKTLTAEKNMANPLGVLHAALTTSAHYKALGRDA